MDQLSPKYEDVSTVISIVPIDISEFKPGLIPGEFNIKGVKDPLKDVSTLVVYRAKYPVYIDENRPSLIVPEPSDRVCEAICRDYKTAITGYESGVAEPGLFWVKGEMTPEQVKSLLVRELDLARKFQNAWFNRLVSIADDDWEKYHQRRMISGMQRVACSVLKLEREWNLEAETLKNLLLRPCKFCKADIDPDAIVCRYCQGIQDRARYDREFSGAGRPAESRSPAEQVSGTGGASTVETVKV